MALVQGMRTTYQTDAETRLVRQIDDQISLLEPDAAPLITFLMRLKKRRAIKASKWQWFEDDYVGRWVQNSANEYNSSATAIVVADATQIVPGDCIAVPKVTASGSTAPEVFRVTAVNLGTSTLTVVRGVGGAGAATIYASQYLRILGPAFEEGAAVATAKSTAPVPKTTYLQIFKTSCKFSKSAIAHETYGAPNGDRAREHKKKLIEHKIKMNSALLFSRPSEDLSGGPGGQPIRTTMGFFPTVATNVTDAGGTLTRKIFEGFSRQAFRYGSKNKVLLAAPLIKSAINEWAREFLLIKPAEKKYGVQVNQVETAHGNWLLVNDNMLESQGDYGFGGMALSVDLDEVEYLYLNNNGENRDTRIMEDVVKDGADSVTDEILTEGGFRIGQEKFHARLCNVSDYV